MENSNPYAPPESEDKAADPAVFRELVRAWEKLRLLYNGIMILPGIGVLALWVGNGLPLAVAIFFGLVTGIGANLAFFLGPLSELYLRGLLTRGAPLEKGRMLIFGGGLVVSAGVIVIAAAIPLL